MLKKFCVEGVFAASVKEKVEQDKKYEMLVPAKLLKQNTPLTLNKNISTDCISGDESNVISPPSKHESKKALAIKKQKNREFPVFMRYVRMNEVTIQITYHHKVNNPLNITDFTLKLPPLIIHDTFVPFRKTLE